VRRLWKILDGLEQVEFWIYALAALLLLLLGPVFLLVRLVRSEQWGWAGLLVLMFGTGLAIMIRDCRRRKFSRFGIGLVMLFLLAWVLLVLVLAFGGA
jgi:hypothetical protein